MTATQMLERVARAIALELDGGNWQEYLPAARAAVAAMREPSTEMLDAATPGLTDYGYLPDEWQAMIKQVLGD
jgi:Holliday junction resolvasome RuvABC DNA-binding subunit